MTKTDKREIWLKASVIGSLWAGIEIIIGSYLHNLRMPMAGSLLTVNAIALMVAFSRMWPEKGLFWRAGLICALMKSISPSAVILGPMIGIFLQSFLFNLSIYALGRNMPAYLIGGLLAAVSSLLHKIGRLLLIYGLDLIQITQNLFGFIAKKWQLTHLEPKSALFWIFGLYFFLGACGVLLGYIVSKRQKMNGPNHTNEMFDSPTDNDLLKQKSDEKFSLLLLSVHIFFIVIGMIALNFLPLLIAGPLILLYLGLTMHRYQSSIRHLKRMGFWLQIFIVIALSTLFFNGLDKGNILDPVGLEAGFRMSMRAIMMVIGFAALSRELRNPIVEMILTKRGFHNLYFGLSLAISVLPAAMNVLAKPQKGRRTPQHVLQNILTQSDILLQAFHEQKDYGRNIFIITGGKHKGKTTYLEKVIALLKDKKIALTGFVAKGYIKNNKRSKFDIVDINSNAKTWLCQNDALLKRKSDPSAIKMGRFSFNPEAFSFGNALLSQTADIAIIDEVGYLEVKNQGWASAMRQIVQQDKTLQLWVVRDDLVQAFQNKWFVPEKNIFHIEVVEPAKVVAALMAETTDF